MSEGLDRNKGYAKPWHEVGRFACVGTVGFVVDAATVGLLHLSLGALWAQGCGYLLAVTVTWLLNRCWTFAGRGRASKWREWIHYVGANGWGALLNNAVYVLAIEGSPWFTRYPEMAVALGSLAGMGANYLAAKHWIFSKR